MRLLGALWAALFVLVACGGSQPAPAAPSQTFRGGLSNQQIVAAWERERAERERQVAEREARLAAERHRAEQEQLATAASAPEPETLDDTALADTPRDLSAEDVETPERPLGPRLTDAQIKRILIDESIDSYPGNCPCQQRQQLRAPQRLLPRRRV